MHYVIVRRSSLSIKPYTGSCRKSKAGQSELSLCKLKLYVVIFHTQMLRLPYVIFHNKLCKYYANLLVKIRKVNILTVNIFLCFCETLIGR